MTLALASCGGGGSDGGGSGIPAPSPGPAPSPAPSPLPVPAPVPAPVAATGTYTWSSIGPSDAERLSSLNRLGADGYFSVRKWLIDSRGDSDDAYMLAKDSARGESRIEYRTVPISSAADALAIFNAQGADGWAYKTVTRFSGPGGGPLLPLFMADKTRNVRYAYETQPTANPMPKTALLNQLNAQGARGFRLLGYFRYTASPGANLYGKESGSGATYSYVFEDGDFANSIDFIQRLHDQGARGLLFRGLAAVDDAQTLVQIYEKNSLQSGALEYRVESDSPTAADNIPTGRFGYVSFTANKAQELGTQGFFYVNPVRDSGVRGFVFVKNAYDNGGMSWLPH